jgi:hypothetical protein
MYTKTRCIFFTVDAIFVQGLKFMASYLGTTNVDAYSIAYNLSVNMYNTTFPPDNAVCIMISRAIG